MNEWRVQVRLSDTLLKIQVSNETFLGRLRSLGITETGTMPLLILAIVMFIAMTVATAVALSSENRQSKSVRNPVRHQYY